MNDFHTRLAAHLQQEDVLIEIIDIDFCDLARWIRQFWEVLANQLGSTPPTHRLTLVASASKPLESKLPLFDPKKEPIENFTPARPVLLPELTAFDSKEVTDWLRTYGGHGVLDAPAIAKRLERFNAQPAALFERLPDHVKKT
jgi:hypothetical protein